MIASPVAKNLFTLLENSVTKKKINKLETTTVWIFPESKFEEYLNKNIIDRYSKNKKYVIISLDSHRKTNIVLEQQKIQGTLLFIKSPFLTNSNVSSSDVDLYLEKIKGVVMQELPNISKNGFVVIQTQDVRVDGYIEPLAKRIIDMLTHCNLWLKEIVIVTKEEERVKKIFFDNYLRITHQYLLIYEVI